MPAAKKSTGPKKLVSEWVLHVQKIWAEMKLKNPEVSYKSAMCAASNCWNKQSGKQYSPKTIGKHPCRKRGKKLVKQCKAWDEVDARRSPSPASS